MGSEGAAEFMYSAGGGLFYQPGYFGSYDPNSSLTLNPKWEDSPSIWGFDGQDLHYPGVGVQVQPEYMYQAEYMYQPQSFDSYQQQYQQYNSSLATDNSIFASQIQQQQAYLANPNFQHQILFPQTGTELYQPSAIENLNYTNYITVANNYPHQNTTTGTGSTKTTPLISYQNSKTQKLPVQISVPLKQPLKPSPLLDKPILNRTKTNSTTPKTLTVKSYTSKVKTGDSHGNITINSDDYNKPDFNTDYSCAKFFVIKSYSEDDVHKSIKYGVWSSTPNGNRKLSAAYEDAQRIMARNNNAVKCPIFLFFSVNGSGHFCGVAEMVGPVDPVAELGLWQQDKWPGRFSVKWHIIKDVPNTTLRQVTLDNNEFKPVTHSRDTQEVLLMPGLAILRLFKNSNAKDSVLDDFLKYEELERDSHRKRTKLLSSDAPVFVPVSMKEQQQTLPVPVEKSPNGDHNPKPNLVGEKEDVMKKDEKEHAVVEANGNRSPNPNPNPNLVGEKEDVKKQDNNGTVLKANGNGGNPNNRNVVVPNGKPDPNLVVKKEPAEKPTALKKDAKKKEKVIFVKVINDANPNPKFAEKEPVKQQVNGTVLKAKNKAEVKENGKVVEWIPKDPNESNKVEKIGSLSINSRINNETGGSSNDVVTIGSMHVRVNNNNKNNP